MAATVNEIAEKCGVSRTTVLRALNGTGSVKPETKDRILEVAQELNYRPNLLARSLNHGCTMSIGVEAINIENLYFVSQLDAINRTAIKNGYFASIAVCDENPKEERKLIQGLCDRQMEGLIISPTGSGEDFIRFLKSLEIPVVCIGNYVSDDFTTVMVNERTAARDAFIHMHEKGYQRIVFVCPLLEDKNAQNIYAHLERYNGVKDACKELSLDPDIIGNQNYLEKVDEVLNDGQNVRTGFLCSGYGYALEIMSDEAKKGRNIPNDFGIMGFDDLSILRYITPGLTTVDTNAEGVASTAVKELISAIEDEDYEPKSVILKHKIIDRETL